MGEQQTHASCTAQTVHSFAQLRSYKFEVFCTKRTHTHSHTHIVHRPSRIFIMWSSHHKCALLFFTHSRSKNAASKRSSHKQKQSQCHTAFLLRDPSSESERKTNLIHVCICYICCVPSPDDAMLYGLLLLWCWWQMSYAMTFVSNLLTSLGIRIVAVFFCVLTD